MTTLCHYCKLPILANEKTNSMVLCDGFGVKPDETVLLHAQVDLCVMKLRELVDELQHKVDFLLRDDTLLCWQCDCEWINITYSDTICEGCGKPRTVKPRSQR